MTTDASVLSAPAAAPIRPSFLQARVLQELDTATASLRAIDAEIADARDAVQKAVEAFAALPTKEQREITLAGLEPRCWEKTDERRALEDRRRAAKKRMRDCITYLCEKQLYSTAQIEQVMASDGAGVLLAMDQVAITRADVFNAVASCEYPRTRRAFTLRHKFGKSNEEIALELGVADVAQVNWMCNRAVEHIHMVLNAPLVGKIRAQFFNYCLAHGLEFPEYADLRGR